MIRQRLATLSRGSLQCRPKLKSCLDAKNEFQNKVSTSKLECRHSSVDLSEPTILLPRARFPSTPSMLFSSIVKFVLQVFVVKRTKLNKKRSGVAHLKKLKLQPNSRFCWPCTSNGNANFLVGQNARANEP